MVNVALGVDHIISNKKTQRFNRQNIAKCLKEQTHEKYKTRRKTFYFKHYETKNAFDRTSLIVSNNKENQF